MSKNLERRYLFSKPSKNIGIICSKNDRQFYVYSPHIGNEEEHNLPFNVAQAAKVRLGDWIEFTGKSIRSTLV